MRVSWLAAAATMVLWSFGTVAAAGEVWKVTSLEWPPFCGEKLPDGGSGVKALRDSLKAEGIELKVEFYPWTRAIATAKKPEYAGFYAAWPEDVGEGFSASGALFRSPLVIIQNKNAPFKFNGLDDLKGKSIAIVQDYGNTKEFNQMVASGAIRGESGIDDVTGVKKLEAKRVEGMIIDINVLKYILKFDRKSAASSIVVNGTWKAEKDLLLAVNNASPNKAKIVDTLNRISKAGKTQKIVDDANGAIFK